MSSSSRSRQKRTPSFAIEPLEARALLSVVSSSLPPAVAAVNTVPIPATPTPTPTPTTTATPTIHVDGFPVNPSAPETPIAHPKVLKPHARAASPKGNANASASDFVSVGKNYLKTIFSSSTAKVGVSYFKAAIRGDGKQLKSLGNTSSVKQVGQNFENLGSSSQVKAVGNSFNSVGKSIASQYHRLIN
jgi:hypothetical protein